MNKTVNQKLTEREVNTLAISISTKTSKTALMIKEYIAIRNLQGIAFENIRKELIDDLLSGGRIFGELRSGLKAAGSGSITRFRDVGGFSEIGVDTSYRWAAVLWKTCPDCIERHGQVKTWEEWEEEGLPRTGHTVCKEHCRCMLIPGEMSVLEPIKRERGE